MMIFTFSEVSRISDWAGRKSVCDKIVVRIRVGIHHSLIIAGVDFIIQKGFQVLCIVWK